MSRSKNDNGQTNENEDVKDVSVFPEGLQMNAWDDRSARGMDVASDRNRVVERRPTPRGNLNSRGRLYFPLEKIPDGWVYGVMTERLLNEPQLDNLQQRYEEGWEFVNQRDHPELMMKELFDHSDNRFRKANCIYMKMPKVDYEERKKAAEEESIMRQKEIAYMTNVYGNDPNDRRFVVENSGSYTPNYQHRGV